MCLSACVHVDCYSLNCRIVPRTVLCTELFRDIIGILRCVLSVLQNMQIRHDHNFEWHQTFDSTLV
jgi:hypothetical protein